VLRFCGILFIVLQKFHASRKYEQCGFILQGNMNNVEKWNWKRDAIGVVPV
jgi:hypothetical protein